MDTLDINQILEITGTALGLVYVVLEVLKKKFMWVVGLLTSAIYIYVFGSRGFYAMAGLNVYYVLISIYGFWKWTKAPDICHIPKVFALRGAVVLGLLFVSLGFLLGSLETAAMPWMEALITALSIVCTWMLSRSYIEQWWLWILANGLAAVMYAMQGMYPTVLLCTAYLLASIIGLRRWRQQLQRQQQQQQVKRG